MKNNTRSKLRGKIWTMWLKALSAFALMAFCSASIAQSVPSEQGGAGTIDPATVTLPRVADFPIAQDTRENPVPRWVATDSSGNHFVGVLLRHNDEPGYSGTPMR